MATEQNKASLSQDPTARTALWGRRLAVVTAIVFCISSVFPAVAAFVTDREAWPRWWGMLDVSIAFLLAILTLAVMALGQGKVSGRDQEASYRAYRILIHGIIVLLVVFFLAGDRIVWSNCLTGFAWRAWLFLYSLPAWFALLRGRLPWPRPEKA
jgi:hypothetical protein